MSLYELAKQFPDMCVSVKLADLMQANEHLAHTIRRDAESEKRRFDTSGIKLIPREDVLELLQVSPSTLWRWETEYNYLKPVKIGRKIYYKECDIKEIINEHSSKTII